MTGPTTLQEIADITGLAIYFGLGQRALARDAAVTGPTTLREIADPGVSRCMLHGR